MTLRPASRRRFLGTLGTAMGALVAAGVTGCATGTDAGPDGTGTGSDVRNNADTLLDRAPVAGEAEVAATPTAAAIRERRQLLIGGDLDLPLLSQQNPVTGQTEGFDADMGRMLAKYIIGEPATKVVPVQPETRESLLEVGTVDTVIRIYSITPARAEKVDFAGPYFLSGQAIATLKEVTDLTRPEDLAGKKVVVVANTTSEAAVKKQAPEADVIVAGSSTECVQALEQHTADAYVHDLTVLAGAAQLNNKIRLAGQPFTQDPYGIGLRHADNSFKAFVNRWLQKIEDQGLWKEAYLKTLGTVVPGGPPSPPKIGSVAGS